MTEIKKASDYQRITIYRPDTMSGGGMDWSNRPELYKTYPAAEQVALSRELSLPRTDAWTALNGDLKRPPAPLDLDSLAQMLFMAYGFTSQVNYGTEVFLYRSAPSAGALYPVEIYVAARDIEGLEDGLYHYSIIDFALTRLRRGTPPPNIPSPGLILTGLFFRSAWKYLKRAFRYCLLDTGHAAENIRVAGAALGLDARFSADFNDIGINQYLGLDDQRETALAIIQLGETPAASAPVQAPVEPVPQAEPVALREDLFDEIITAARLTADPLKKPPADFEWPRDNMVRPPATEWSDFEGPSLVQVLQQRRSRRNFKPKTVTQQDLARLLDMVLTPSTNKAFKLGLVLNEVQDISDGIYFVNADGPELVLHQRGFISPSLGLAALSQDWVGRANIIMVIIAPLDQLEEQYGPRSLRLAYLEAGRLGQKAYLAAETMGWGCCGVGAFMDEQVQKLLNLPPEEYPLYILPVGPIKKRTHGGRKREG
jgi:SagB-type dehydrogenase family enzyme